MRWLRTAVQPAVPKKADVPLALGPSDIWMVIGTDICLSDRTGSGYKPNMSDTSDHVEEAPSFPSGWPPCCPPEDARPAQGTFFRAVENNIVTYVDFQSALETTNFLNSDPCKRAAISLNATQGGILHGFRLFPFRSHWFIATI